MRTRRGAGALAGWMALALVAGCEAEPEVAAPAADTTADVVTGADVGATELPPLDADPATLPRFVHYLRGDVYPRLVLELDAVPGRGPEEGVADDLVAGLAPLLDKPAGVEVVTDGALAARGAEHAWTFAELSAVANESFDLEVAAGTVKMHVLFVDGHYAEDTASSKVLGLAWSHTHLVIFKDTIAGVCEGGLAGPLSAALEARLCESTELGIWTHETGHLLGLVGNGLPMVSDHKDPEHGAHDHSDECIMYWAYQGQALADLFRTRLLAGDEPDLGFDAACLADLAAIRDAP